MAYLSQYYYYVVGRSGQIRSGEVGTEVTSSGEAPSLNFSIPSNSQYALIGIFW